MLNIWLGLSEKRLIRLFLTLLFLLLFFFSFTLINYQEIRAEGLWEDLRQYNRGSTGFSSEIEDSIINDLKDILSIFQAAPHLNPPPPGLSRIRPEIRLSKPPELISEQSSLPRAELNLRMWFAGQGRINHSGLVTISVNKPEALLGKPALIDDDGGLYILPPIIDHLESGPLYCKQAHPPGYEEEYPCRSFFPLWNPTVEPVLYSVVFPLFRLSRFVGVATELMVDDTSFWEPVSQERWIRALQRYCQSELDFHLEAVKAEREQEVGWTEKQVEKMRKETEKMRHRFSAEKTIEMNEKMIKSLEDSIELIEHQLENPGFFQLDENRQKKYKEQIQQFEYEIDKLKANLEEQIITNQEMAEEWIEMMEAMTRAVIIQKGLLEDIGELILKEKWDEMEEIALEYEIDHLLLLAEAGKSIGYLDDELQQLSAAERAAPAYGFDIPGFAPGTLKNIVPISYEAERTSGLINPDQEGARAVVAVNPDFFNEKVAEDTIKLIVVEWWEATDAMHYSPGASYYSEARVNMRENLWESLDWDSLMQKIR